jgi:hypothetical protein
MRDHRVIATARSALAGLLRANHQDSMRFTFVMMTNCRNILYVNTHSATGPGYFVTNRVDLAKQPVVEFSSSGSANAWC